MKKLLLLLFLLFVSFAGFSQSRYISKTTKQIVFTRDGGICKCCGSSINLEYDHIVPFSCGGSSSVANIQLLCKKCNRSKSNSCVCKVHDRIVGTDCCDKKTIKKLSSTTSTTTNQCRGTTKKGTRCKKRTKNENGYCYLHQ
jgi:5-methylcytosine-specific restriction endonuclease McrA